ncbi:sugar transferase [Fulvivirga lutea]|uniref:Sugar transferase n=1 Tax=Fulvivirga lutea TaxID=2810512 RepID=A0A974WED1_9BACT|nr:sugar transferase [Fulvivirga lutea]QSE96794.1 sugar transferase [Fulvivirga lutea]
MSPAQRIVKRLFDITFSLIGLLLFGWLIMFLYIIAAFDTKLSGFFIQERIGIHGRIVRIIKLRTMRNIPEIKTSITTANDPRISRFGKVFRKLKLDELPQLINVLKGDMSFVGPRPDIPGYADKLEGRDREILNIRPGITGPASLFFRFEEGLLSNHENPDVFNDSIIWPKKVELNREYVTNYSLLRDIYYIFVTILGIDIYKNKREAEFEYSIV